MKLNDLFEVQDPKEVAARAVEHAEDELGPDASKSAIKAFVKKMYGDEIARYITESKEDWQDDIDGDGAGIGVCPKCGGEARYTSSGKSLRDAAAYWECQKCGHTGEKSRY